MALKLSPAISPTRHAVFIAVVAVSALFGGCSSHYSLVARGSDTILLPPRAAPAEAETSFEAEIQHARVRPASTSDCDVADGPLSLHWHDDAANVRLSSVDWFQLPGVHLAPAYVIDSFQRALLDIESRGCLRPDEDFALKQAIAERLPLPVSLSQRLLFGSFDVAGFYDLTSGFRMKVTTPLYKEGAERSAQSLLAYETARYSFVRSHSDDHVRIEIATIDRRDVTGRPSTPSEPQGEPAFYRSFGYFRLLFRSTPVRGTSLTQAIVLSAGDKPKINQATKQIQAGFANFCQAVVVPDVSCVTFPPDVGVSLEIRVIVNGKPTFIQAVGASIGDVVDAKSIPKTLRISRNFQGHPIPIQFDPATVDISSLALMPGDRIRR